MSVKLPNLKDIGRVAFDPFDFGAADAVFGQDDIAPGNEAEKAAQAKAVQDELDAIRDFEENGFTPYEWGGDVSYEQLGELPQLGRSEMNNISVDPRYHDYELDALRSLEDSAQNGMTATDRADMARLNSDVNRQNSGRVGAIGQNMQARGLGGSGLEMVSQMQGAQAAADREALAAMEKAGQIQQGKRQASQQLGQLGSQMKANDFGQQAQIAGANDAITRFNTQNSINRLGTNVDIANQGIQQNHQGRQGILDKTTGGKNQHAGAVLGAKQGGVKTVYNAAADSANATTGAWAADQDNQSATKNAVLGGAVKIGTAGMAGKMSRKEEDEEDDY